MDTLTRQQKEQAFRYMEQHQDDGWDLIAARLSELFGRLITGEDCSKFYIHKLMGG